MQKILFAAAVLFSTLPASQSVLAQAQAQSQAQTQAPAQAASSTGQPAILKEGRIIYQRKLNVWRRIDESMKSMMPEYNTSKSELDFSSDESIYKNLKEEEDIRDNAGQDGNKMVLRFNAGGPDDQTYRNYSTEQATEQHELGPKKYLVVDSLQRQSWKLETDTRTIMGYNCKKATTKGRNNSDVIAWYSEDIQAPSGPEYFGGLPGLILEINVNDGEMAYTPLEIITKDFDRKMVAAPTAGKKITRAEYRKMLEDSGMGGPGVKRVIRISHD